MSEDLFSFDEVDFIDDPNNEVFQPGDNDNESITSEPVKTTSAYHIQQAEKALRKLKFVVEESGWKKALAAKTATVYVKNGTSDSDKLPIFMSEHVIENFTPQSIFAVIGMRKLWDQWYEEGSLIENLDETTSLTYMVMRGIAGTRPRDLSLVEKIHCTEDGTIYFVSTSIETHKVPRVVDRIRARILLNGWIVQPISLDPIRTKVTYVLQTRVYGWIPSVMAKKYLLKRPLVVHAIDEYLQKNGPPPMVISSTTTTTTTISNRPPPSVSQQVTKDWMDQQQFKAKRKGSFQGSFQGQAIIPITHTSQNIEDTLEPISPKRVYSPTKEISPRPKPPKSPSHKMPSFTPPISPTPISPTPISPTPISSTPISSTTLSTPFSSLSLPKPPPIKPLTIKHRYTDALNNAIKMFKENAKSLNGWDLYTENKGLKVYTKDSGKTTPIIRGDYTIVGNYEVEDFLSIIKDLHLRKLWDDRFESGENIEVLNNGDVLSRVTVKGSFPVSDRDFSTCGTTIHDSETHSAMFVTTSVVDPKIPEVRKCVRANAKFTGWQIDPKFDSDDNIKALNIIYIVDIDIKLDSVPSSILKSISTGTPMVIQKIDAMLKNVGFPPYVTKPSSIISENIDQKTFQYNLSLATKNDGGVAELRLSKKMYPNGFDVAVIPNNTKVELLSDDSEGARIIFPSYDKLQIKVTKHTSKGFKMTYNGNDKIPQTLITKPKKQRPKPIIIEKMDKVATRTSSQPLKESEIVSQSQRNSKESNDQNNRPRSILISNGSNADESNRPNRPRKKTLSFADSPKFIPDPSVSNEETFPKYEVRSSISLYNNKKYENMKLAEHVLDLNPYQAGMMFIAMMLAYFLGRFSCYFS